MAKNNVEEQTTASTTKSEEKFKLSKLRANCLELYGVVSSTFDGAVSDLKTDKTYTVEEVGTHIEKWKKKEAK